MVIGIDARLWNETGVGRYIRSLFKYLPKNQKFVWFFNEKEFTSLEMPGAWKKVLAKPHWHTISEQFIMPVLFYRERLDLVHVPYVNFPLFYFGKTISTIHDLIPDHYKTGKVTTLPWWFYIIKKIGYHFLVWMATKRAIKILTLSYDAKNEIIDHYHTRADKIIAIHEAGDLEEVPKLGPALTKKPYLLYVGNAHPHKNVEALIKAAEILKIKLVLVGSDSFFYPRLPKSKYVETIGLVLNSKIADWYRHAAALVTASKMEGFGIPPLEAMSVGCPAIVSDIPVFHEVYGDAAIYFNQNDPQDIAKVIKETLANKKLLKEMIEKGYSQVAKYSWKKCVKETHEVYESCLSLRSGK